MYLHGALLKSVAGMKRPHPDQIPGMFPLSEGTENTPALCVLATKSECFRAGGRMPRRAGLGEFPFRNISYVRKAANCLEYEVFAARQTEMVLAPLNSHLELCPKEAQERAIFKCQLLVDSSPGWSMIQTLRHPIRA